MILICTYNTDERADKVKKPRQSFSSLYNIHFMLINKQNKVVLTKKKHTEKCSGLVMFFPAQYFAFPPGQK